jgi:hypothetical protein
MSSTPAPKGVEARTRRYEEEGYRLTRTLLVERRATAVLAANDRLALETRLVTAQLVVRGSTAPARN